MKPRKVMPPKLAQRILRWFLKNELAEEVEGDLEEKLYSTVKNKSLISAKLNYWYQVFNYIRPFAIRILKSKAHYPSIMIRHNILISLRNFRRSKSTFIINLVGLSAGLCCVLLIYLWVSSELSMDKFHEKDGRLFRVMQNQQLTNRLSTTTSTPWLLAETLADEMPEVEYATVSTDRDWFDKFTLSSVEKNFQEKNIKAEGLYVGKDYFNVFSFPLTQGDKDKVLVDKYSIVLSEEVAYKLFNRKDDVVGKSIEVNHDQSFIVSGIFKNIPNNSSIQFDILFSFAALKELRPQGLDWRNSGPETFVLLKEGTDVTAFQQKIKDFIKSKTQQTHRTLFLTSFSKSYLHNKYSNGQHDGGRIEYVRFFIVIAIFILAIACINFMNLATARATQRAKEIGIKKAIGAYRSSLILQHLIESTLISFGALVIAVVTTYLFLPQFNLIIGQHLALVLDFKFILTLMGIVFVTGLIAGSYPAIYLSGFRPAMIMKGKLSSAVGEAWTRKGLVIFQFTISIIFISAVMIVYSQIQFIQSKNIGYDRNNVIYFGIEGKVRESLETFLNELNNVPGVIGTSSLGQSMVGGGNTSNLDWPGKDPNLILPFAFRPVGYDAISLLGLEMTRGRTYSRSLNDTFKVIFNEAGIAAMEMKEPLGQIVDLGSIKCEIIGVVNDFNFESLHIPIKPMFFILAPQYTEKVIVKIQNDKVSETLSQIDKFYNSYNPGFTFDFRFLDQDYQEQYASEKRVSTLTAYFAGIAIVISCLGLFGLATFTTERRLKEIGIRKVMGSGEWRIVYLLTKDFSLIVFTSILIALPISYYLTKGWLDGYAYHVTADAWYFIGSGLIALLISWLTVGSLALKASRVNPTVCLKEE